MINVKFYFNNYEDNMKLAKRVLEPFVNYYTP